MKETWRVNTGGLLLIFSLLLVLLLFYQQLWASERNQSRQPLPKVVKLEARLYSFEPKTITLRKGRPVRLVITSSDIDHGFAVQGLNIDEKIEGKQTKVILFTPRQAGRFRFYCSVFCGDGHARMTGEIVVTEDEE